MRFISLFSGIEAASMAWLPLGWECVAVCEVDPFASAVLAQRHPGVPNLGDVTKVTAEQIAALGQIDLIVFGSPCQDLSVAGKRKGLDGERSGLFFDAIRIVQHARTWGGCRFALWENVPGAFSSNEGRDFAAVVEHLAGIESVDVPPKGWGTEGCAVGDEGMVEWATLDAQWFGVAQRRRRVFALADFGDWANRPPVLLEPDSLRGDSAPSRKPGQDAAAAAAASHTGGSPARLIASGNAEGSPGLPFLTCSNIAKTVNNQTPLLAFDMAQVTSPANRSVPKWGDPCHPLTSRADCAAVAFMATDYKNYTFEECDTSRPITTSADRSRAAPIAVTDVVGTQSGDGVGSGPSFLQSMQVRRLTPRECERLQGFPDDYTLVTVRGKPAADGPRYKALGNSMAVPVMRWIGERIEFVSSYF